MFAGLWQAKAGSTGTSTQRSSKMHQCAKEASLTESTWHKAVAKQLCPTGQLCPVAKDTARAHHAEVLTNRHWMASLGPQGEAPKSCIGDADFSSNIRTHASPDADAY
jgi:hypothetical protein